MSALQITESEVDSIVIDLLGLHNEAVNIDVNAFHDLLKHSLSLNTMEKKRVLEAVPTLSQFQFDELAKVFTEEREKFKELAQEHPEDIKKLLAKQQSEWIQLGDIFASEQENASKQADDLAKQEEIKKSLGL